MYRRLREIVHNRQHIASRVLASLWHRLYWARYRLFSWIARYRAVIGLVVLASLIATSGFFVRDLQRVLSPYILTVEHVGDLRALLMQVGGALIGGTTIAFSLVLFAMQVNIERMPHGLFRKLSSDPRLLGAFVTTFLLAILIAASSLVPTTTSPYAATIAVLGAAWAVPIIPLIFLYAYTRALLLINPGEQLRLVVLGAQKELRAWAKRADRAAPLFELGIETKPSPSDEKHDVARLRYYLINLHWTARSLQSIEYAISLHKTYADRSDYEVSGLALDAVVAINASYITAKGKTFFSAQLLFDNPLVTDPFINHTLEHLRQSAQIGLSSGDERQLVQVLRSLAQLARVYLAIDYGSEEASKTHTHLASGYLANAVSAVLPHNMPDVAMDGVRLMGIVATQILVRGGDDQIAILVERIAQIACTGIARENYRPVTLEGIQQLTALTLSLMKTQSRDGRFAVRTLRDNINLVARVFLTIPDKDAPFSSSHSTYLAPYFSSTIQEALISQLANLVNAVSQATATDKIAQNIVRNLEHWADGLSQSIKDLFLLALEKRSHFAFDLLHWISHMARTLLAISNAPACNEQNREELRKHARWLVAVLSCIPADKETVAFAENFGVTEQIFEVALDAWERGCGEVSAAVRGLLMGWAFKAAPFHTGWAIPARALCGLAALALLSKGDSERVFVAEFFGRLSQNVGLPQDMRAYLASEIRDRAHKVYSRGSALSRIDDALSRVDPSRLVPLLEEIANALVPTP